MKLLLKENVKHLGRVGDVVEVKDGYGRNYLLPQGLALTVTRSNLEAMEAEKKRRQAVEDAKVGEYRILAERIGATDVILRERTSDGTHLYGSVSAKEIGAALAEQGIEIDTDKIEIASPIRLVGTHTVQIRLHRDVIAELKVWVTDLKEEGDEDDDDADEDRDEDAVDQDADADEQTDADEAGDESDRAAPEGDAGNADA